MDMEMRENCLKAHNEYRAKHGSPPLQLNHDICKITQKYAEEMAKSGKLAHSGNSDYGENVYMFGTSNANYKVTGREPVEQWYKEVNNYNFDKAIFVPGSGHFTQMIWKNTKEMGVGCAQEGTKFYFVVNYKPPGNMKDKFKENVLRAK